MNLIMAMNMGGDDFIPKPFDWNVLLAKIQRCCGAPMTSADRSLSWNTGMPF